jgi:hypothetical protein
MTDAETILLDELEQFVPPENFDGCDWSDVLARAGRPTASTTGDRQAKSRRVSRRPTLVLLALLVVLAVAGGAYAVARLVIVGSPAPKPVRVSEQLLAQVRNAMETVNHRPNVEVAKTKAAAVVNTSAGPAYLWVAPTPGGSRCLFLQITGLEITLANHGRTPYLLQPQPAACIDARQPQALLNIVTTGVHGHPLTLIFGFVPAPARTLQLRYPDGTTSKSYPLRGGLVLAVSDPSENRPTVVLYDALGNTITTHRPVWLIPEYVMDTPTGPSHVVATMKLHNGRGTFVLRVGPSAGGGTCEQLQEPPFGVSSGCDPHKPTPDEIQIADDYIEGVSFLKGPVGSNVQRLEMRYGSGPSQTVPIQHGYVLFQLLGERRPLTLVAYDHAGRVLATSHLG